MNENLKKIREYLLGLGLKEEELKAYESSSVYLANMIMEYAHRGQKRENGEDYANHPSRIFSIITISLSMASKKYACYMMSWKIQKSQLEM